MAMTNTEVVEAETDEIVIRDERVGIIWISRAIDAYKLSSSALLAYVAIARFCYDDATCEANHDTLAQYCALEKPAFEQGFKELEEKKVITEISGITYLMDLS